MTDATHRLVEGYIRTEPLGPVSVKGKEWACCGLQSDRHRRHRSRLDVKADRGLTALIGREREAGGSPRLLRPREEHARPSGRSRGRAGHRQIATAVMSSVGLWKARPVHVARRSLCLPWSIHTVSAYP